MKKLTQKLNSIRLFLEAHPDNEPNSELADRIEDLKELPKLIEEYAQQFRPEWISVHGSMPRENSGLYFVYDGKDVGIARMSVLQFRTLTSNEVWSDITHYAPIIKPEPPKED